MGGALPWLKKPRFQGLASAGAPPASQRYRVKNFVARDGKSQVGPKINTAYPQDRKFFLANGRRMV